METGVVPEFDPPRGCGDQLCRDYFFEFILICIVPSALVVLIAFIVAIVMCCSCSTCCRKKKTQLSEEQMLRYEAVRRASLSLRQMSHKRDTPLLGSRRGSSSTLDRDHRHRRPLRPRDTCNSAPGTLQRHRHRESRVTGSGDLEQPPPPAYSLPPDYPALEGEGAYAGPAIQLHDFHSNTPSTIGDNSPELSSGFMSR